MDAQQLLLQAQHVIFPGTQRPQDTVPPGGFQLAVDDVFSITGRGTVVTGRVLAGSIKVGDQVTITRAGQQVGATLIAGVEMFRKKVTEAHAGDNVGLILEGVRRDQVLHGDVLSR